MRLIFKSFLSLVLAFTLSQPCFAEETAAPERGIVDKLKGVSKDFFPRPPADFSQPYMKDAKIPQNTQWNEQAWHPEDWAESKGGVQQVLDGFIESRLVIELHEDEVPVLEVGLPFMRVSPADQRRVIEFMDYAYRITDETSHGVFYIVLEDHMDELLGIYSKKGLQFQ